MSSTSPSPRRDRPDRVVRLIITHWVFGAMLGMVCATLLLWLDVAGLRSLVLRTDHITWEALVLLFGGFAVTFGGVVSAAAVMAISTNNDNPGRGPGLRSSDASARSVVGSIYAFLGDSRSSPMRQAPAAMKLRCGLRINARIDGEIART